jgi:hypothetical protein
VQIFGQAWEFSIRTLVTNGHAQFVCNVVNSNHYHVRLEPLYEMAGAIIRGAEGAWNGLKKLLRHTLDLPKQCGE